ncbi:MAG: maleylpyruvate isomerase family mycothiol-dependent enzyme [Pseudonocardiaceae bacterium]|nr:maleylpyruvate isomerase family mycothiol-dependent enzyme [Pseudonocardiaceae bacterium]
MTDYAAVYRESRHRIADLVRDLPDGDLARRVSSCPAWTVADTVAHLAAGACEVAAGRMDRIPTDEQTAEGVAARRTSAVADVLAEWEGCGPSIEHAVDTRQVPLNIVHDVVTHEADLRGALGAGRPPEQAWQASLDHLSRGFGAWLGRSGQLTVVAGEHRFTAGEGEPVTTVEVDGYEFWRALFGRRSTAQMAGWGWDGDPAPHLAAIPIFGPTDADLVEAR